VRRHLPFWGVGVVVLVLDQAAKALVRQKLPLHEGLAVIPNVFHLTHAQNRGAAFGMLPQGAALHLAVSLVAVVFLVGWGARLCQGSRPLFWGLALLQGGAAGNLLDRLRQGFVTDFLDFRVWPVFNLADIALTVGAALLALGLLFPPPAPEAGEKESSCDPS